MDAQQLTEKFDEFPLCERIALFFLGHPDAVDTLEGIADWWVQEDRHGTRDALVRLVELGIVVSRVRGGRELFSYTTNPELRTWVERHRGRVTR